MPRNNKYSPKIKIHACEDYLSGELSMREICEKYDISYNEKSHTSKVFSWLHIYKHSGRNGFFVGNKNNSYSKEFKTMVVEAYIAGEGSFEELASKYKIPSSETLRQWFLRYNANRELKDYCPKQEVYMAETRRKTTMKERKEIVEYCINHNQDYKETAKLYAVSYNQVYSWVKKYNESGEEGLIDKRGHHKTDDEVDELERLRRENKRLKRQLEENDMLVQLLKKVKEFEGM